MTDRGISTVVDVALCLLLVSASVGVLATAHPPERDTVPSAGPAAGIVATVTATVTYDDGERTARGTLAGLLANAARLEAEPGPSSGLATAARAATARALENVSGPVQVVAVWRPSRNATPIGRVSVGDRPPPDADVTARSFDVPDWSPQDTAPSETSGTDDPRATIVVRRWSP